MGKFLEKQISKTNTKIENFNIKHKIALYVLMKLSSYFKMFPQRKLWGQMALLVNCSRYLMKKYTNCNPDSFRK